MDPIARFGGSVGRAANDFSLQDGQRVRTQGTEARRVMREGTVPLGSAAVMDPRSAAISWPVSSSLALGALRTASPCGRLHARAVLAEWGLRDLAEAAELVVSELVTNAVRASTGPDGRPRYGEAGLLVVILRLTTDAAQVLIEVWDDIPAAPVAVQAGPEDESGRG
jgi:hypothetical protein